MKIKTVILFFVILFILCNLSTLAQSKPPDSTKTPAQSVQYQGQIDSLKVELERINRNNYEKAIERADKDIDLAGLVIKFVALLVAILGALGLFNYFRTSKVRGQMREELDKAKVIREEVEKKKEEVTHLCKEIQRMRSESEEGYKKIKSLSEVLPGPEMFSTTEGIQMEAKKGKALEHFSEEAKAIISEKDAERAIQRYEKLTDKIFGEDALIVYDQLAFSYYRLGRYEEVISILKKIIGINPKNAIAYNNWGVVLGGLGKHQEATEKYDKAIAFKPDYAEAYNNWGNALGSLGKHEQAIEKYKKATEIKPDLAGAYVNWGNALAKIGKHKEAIEKYKKAIELNPDLVEAYNNWGAALAELGEHKEAIEKYKKAIELKPDHASVYYNLACAFAKLEDKIQMLRYLQEAIKFDKKFKEQAKTDEDFKDFWDDPDFKKLVE